MERRRRDEPDESPRALGGSQRPEARGVFSARDVWPTWHVPRSYSRRRDPSKHRAAPVLCQNSALLK